MLGRGEDKERVIASLKIAAQSGKDTVVHGFAIGRTLFAQELRDAHEGKITKAQASQRIAENFREMIDIWNNV